jgi:hypothetical protein
MSYLMVAFFGIGLLFGNLSTLAMQPLGAIAGTGSAVVGGSLDADLADPRHRHRTDL